MSVIDRLAEAEGVSSADYRLPMENFPLLITKLKAGRKAEKTINLYKYNIEKFLKKVTMLTRGDVGDYLAKRIEEKLKNKRT